MDRKIESVKIVAECVDVFNTLHRLVAYLMARAVYVWRHADNMAADNSKAVVQNDQASKE